jgi:hypothetical protein
MAQKKVKPSDIDRFNRPLYKGLPLNRLATRMGSLDILKQPSRISNSLFYPDGSIVKKDCPSDD